MGERSQRGVVTTTLSLSLSASTQASVCFLHQLGVSAQRVCGTLSAAVVGVCAAPRPNRTRCEHARNARTVPFLFPPPPSSGGACVYMSNTVGDRYLHPWVGPLTACSAALLRPSRMEPGWRAPRLGQASQVGTSTPTLALPGVAHTVTVCI